MPDEESTRSRVPSSRWRRRLLIGSLIAVETVLWFDIIGLVRATVIIGLAAMTVLWIRDLEARHNRQDV
jgi:hypothetical protein